MCYALQFSALWKLADCLPNMYYSVTMLILIYFDHKTEGY